MSSPNPMINSKSIRILLLDYHDLVREGMRLLIECDKKMQVVGQAGGRAEAIALAQQLNPDIVLLELNLDGELDLQIIPELLTSSHHIRIILLTGIREAHTYYQAVQLGAMGVVRKTESSRVLLKAIEKVYQGEVWIDRIMMAQVLSRLSSPYRDGQEDEDSARIAQLSERELEVIQLIGKGLKNKEIAERLYISEVTVRHHLTSIYSKLGVSDRLELIIYAYRNNLAELPA
jgi:two-component system nitrate/nitrite response regulator NarL